MKSKKILGLSIAVLAVGLFAYSAPKLQRALAQVSTYPVSTLTDAGDVNFLLQVQAIKFENGKWTYNFTWKRTRDAEGRLVVAPKVNESVHIAEVDPAPRQSSSPLVVQLDPATRYVFKYFSSPSSVCGANPDQSPDPDCIAIRTIYFNTRDQNGKIMSTSEVPLSQGGTKVDSPLTNSSLDSSVPASAQSLQAQINALLALVQQLLAQISGISQTPVITTTGSTGNSGGVAANVSPSNTANVSACLAAVSQYPKFQPEAGVSPHFTINSQLAQQMKTWQRCHYDPNYGNHLDPSGNHVFTVSLTDQRKAAQDCVDLFKQQASQLGFDSAQCSVGEYCGTNDANPDSFCSPTTNTVSDPQRYMGRSIGCTLSEGSTKLFVGQADAVVGNDYGPGSSQAEPQAWREIIGNFNTEIAKTELGSKYSVPPFDAWLDVAKRVFRGADTAQKFLTVAPQACSGVINVKAVANSYTSATVTWQAPSSVSNVSIYLIGHPDIGKVPGHENDLLIDSTVAENVTSKDGVNTYTFTIPLESALGIPARGSWLYGWFSNTGSIDSAVQKASLSNVFFVRVVADNGLFGDSNRFGLNGQDVSLNPDYGTKSNPPSSPGFTQSCEAALPTSIDVGNANCYNVNSSSATVGFLVNSAWYPGNFNNASMVLRVAEDNNGRGEQAVKGGCANLADCFMKIDDVWHDNRYVQSYGDFAQGSFVVAGLKPNTKYWFRTAAVCNAGQSNQTYKDEVWSCTTKPATTAICANECSLGQSQCMPNTKGVRQLCGNFDSDSCLEWGSGTIPGGEGVAFIYDSSCK